MRVVVAPNALKGSLTAVQAAQAMRDGVLAARPEADVVAIPVSDGGDGLVEVLHAVLGGEIVTTQVTGPLGEPVEAGWLLLRDRRTGVVEMAQASGLALLDADERDVMAAQTVGVGDLMLDAFAAGCRTLCVGLGGSATCDGGMGMAVAMGVRFLDFEGEELPPMPESLVHVCSVDRSGLHDSLRGARVEALCDVGNPLLGERGAARTFAPQKGATAEQVDALERGLARLAHVADEAAADLPGSGAAGGLGFGIAAFLRGALLPGAERVLELCAFEAALEGAHLVLTAEGSLDAQTLLGKAPLAVARAARRSGVPCIALAARVQLDDAQLRDAGFASAHALGAGGRATAGRMLRDRTREVAQGLL